MLSFLWFLSQYAQFTNRSLKPISKNFQQNITVLIYICRPTRTILSATIFINWCCLNRKTLGYKKEPVMVYSFRENVPHLFLWFLWCHLLMKTKTRTTETTNNHTTSHWHSSINCKTLYLTSSEWINPYVIYLESNFFY